MTELTPEQLAFREAAQEARERWPGDPDELIAQWAAHILACRELKELNRKLRSTFHANADD